MRLAVRIGLALALTLAALVMMLGTQETGLEILAVLLLIVLLVARELTSSFTTEAFRGRYDVFVWTGLGLFVLIIVRRIAAILGL